MASAPDCLAGGCGFESRRLRVAAFRRVAHRQATGGVDSPVPAMAELVRIRAPLAERGQENGCERRNICRSAEMPIATMASAPHAATVAVAVRCAGYAMRGDFVRWPESATDWLNDDRPGGCRLSPRPRLRFPVGCSFAPMAEWPEVLVFQTGHRGSIPLWDSGGSCLPRGEPVWLRGIRERWNLKV